jgi:lipoyl(octanoyl) transferase
MNAPAPRLRPCFPRSDGRTVDWAVSPGLTPYDAALGIMEARAAAIAEDAAPELVWLLEHPPLYSAGVSARPADLLTPDRFPVVQAGRGGQYTYHGPGQRVAYVMLDLKVRGRDLRAFVTALETWIIDALAGFGVVGETHTDRVGVWVSTTAPDGRVEEAKIAAIGVKVRRWVSFHGISLNVAPDLEHFAGIVPCGIREHGVTSLAALGIEAPMSRVDEALAAAFAPVFGPLRPAGARSMG